MHWSKSRHIAFETCPRRFFYEEIAAPRNPNVKALVDRKTPPLIRHEAVRKLVIALAKAPDVNEHTLDEALARTEEILKKAIPDEYEVNAQMSIVDTCVRSFVEEYRSKFVEVSILYTHDGRPAEFTYDGQAMMCLPEISLDREGKLEIFTFKTGSSDFRSEHEFWLRAGVLTCWARSVLKRVDSPVVIKEVYLREECMEHELVLEDEEVSDFVRQAKDMASTYSSTAKIRDFPAEPDWSGCRFCTFKEICPEWQNFAEVDYALSALANRVVSSSADSSQVSSEVERKTVFLSHVSTDKKSIVRPFARALEAAGISYWLDEAEILWGDSLIKSVNDGLKKADYLVCFLSSAFCDRGWTEGELGAALSTELSGKRQRVLPVIIGDRETVLEEYPLLRDKRYVKWDDGIEQIIGELEAVISRSKGKASRHRKGKRSSK